MDLNINEGTRPSKLDLARYHTGELSGGDRDALEQRLNDADRAWLEDVDAARADVPAFDSAAIRARAHSGQADTPVENSSVLRPAAANNRTWYGVAMLLAAAIVGFLVIGTADETAIGADETRVEDIRARGVAGLKMHVFAEGALRPWEGQKVGEGDALGFAVQGSGHDGVVLLSVDGAGQVTVFWPESGNAPEPLAADGLVRLPGSIVLDGAPGPEVFLAVYDQTAAEARDHAERTWQSGGPDALTEWAEQADHVEALVVDRR